MSQVDSLFQEGESGDPPPEGQQPALPEKLTFEARKGQKVEMKMDKVIDLARQGLDYSRKMETLKEERARIEQDQKALQIGQEMRRLGEAKPEVAEYIVRLANGLEELPQAPGSASTSGQLDEEELTDAERALLQHNRKLENEVKKLTSLVQSVNGRFSATEEKTRMQEIENEIRREAQAIAHWDDEDINDLTPMIAMYMHQHQDASVFDAVQAMASMDSKRAARRAEKLSTRQNDRLRYRTVPPGASAPSATPKTQYKSKDLHSGKVLSDALENVRQFFPNW